MSSAVLASGSRQRHTGIWRATLGFRVDYDKGNHHLRFKFIDADYAARFVKLNKSGGG